MYGDHCLDRYMVGRMEVISRDAPVPIVRLYEDRYTPGGGGNVAMNLRALGAQVVALGAVGDDNTSEILRRCYDEAGIETEFLHACPGRHAIAFNKLYAKSSHGSPQQVARFDQENADPLPRESEEQIRALMDRVTPGLDAVVICDYEEVAGTGGVTPAVLEHLRRLAAEHGVVLSADSRMRIESLAPVDIVAPNDLEAAAAARLVDLDHRGEITEDMVLAAGRKLTHEAGIRYVIITRGEKGMTVFQRDADPETVAAPPAGEIDVTGAGDAALAALTLGHVSGLPIRQCAELANLAAHVTIHKLNTTGTASPEELAEALESLRAERGGEPK